MCKLVVIDDNPTDHYIMQRLLHNNYNCEQATYTYDGKAGFRLPWSKAKKPGHYPM